MLLLPLPLPELLSLPLLLLRRRLLLLLSLLLLSLLLLLLLPRLTPVFGRLFKKSS